MRTLTYNGVSSDSVGVRLLSMPVRYAPSRYGESIQPSGRDGDIFYGTGARGTYPMKVECSARHSRLSEISAWLVASGRLVFSDEPTAAIDARIQDEVEFRRVSNDSDPLYRFTISFVCQPFFTVLPEAADITVTQSDTLITNPYNAYSKPMITVRGSGDVTLNIGSYTCYLNELTDGMVIDSELLDAFTLDKALLANNQFDGEFPLLRPGNQFISWNGMVTSIVIKPRWRKL